MGSEDGWDRDAGDSGVTVTMGWQGQEWWEHLDGGDRDGRNRELWGQGDAGDSGVTVGWQGQGWQGQGLWQQVWQGQENGIRVQQGQGWQ